MNKIQAVITVAVGGILSSLSALAADSDATQASFNPFSWKGRKIVFLGDSITDKNHVGCETNYWGFLAERMGFTPYVYGISGQESRHIPQQVARARDELGNEVDAVFMLMGTNDFYADVPLGEVFVYSKESVDRRGHLVEVSKREPSMDEATFNGRLNIAFRSIKTTFPNAQVVVMTPLHRGFAKFSPDNVQPDERYANEKGLYIDDYVKSVREVAAHWSSPVIDLYAESGLLPNESVYNFCFAKGGTGDSLHPSTAGHERLARILEARLRVIPSTFR